MPSKKTNKVPNSVETDGAFLFKVVFYAILASFWIKFQQPLDLFIIGVSGIPVGFLIGLLVANHEKLQIDRKIEYVVLVVMTVVTYFIPAGIVL